MQLHESESRTMYLLYWLTISERNLAVIHSIFCVSFSCGTGMMTGLLIVKYLNLGFWLGRMKF